jgi:hypothetical protein
LIGQNTSRKGEREMNKVNWEIVSKGDFGPIKLGMTKPEINAILGDDVFHRNMIPHFGLAGDNYGRKNVIIHYCIRNGVKEAVYIEVGYPFKVVYMEKDLMRMSLPDAKLNCEKNGILVESVEIRPGSWRELCLSEGIGLNSSSASSRHLNSVFMFSDGYFETRDEYWQGYKRQLIMEVQELKFQRAKDKGEGNL